MTEIQIQHQVKKSKVRGKLEIHYRCPNCTEPLRALCNFTFRTHMI